MIKTSLSFTIVQLETNNLSHSPTILII